MRAKEQN